MQVSPFTFALRRTYAAVVLVHVQNPKSNTFRDTFGCLGLSMLVVSFLPSFRSDGSDASRFKRACAISSEQYGSTQQCLRRMLSLPSAGLPVLDFGMRERQ